MYPVTPVPGAEYDEFGEFDPPISVKFAFVV
jgi:hypothetical protein